MKTTAPRAAMRPRNVTSCRTARQPSGAAPRDAPLTGAVRAGGCGCARLGQRRDALDHAAVDDRLDLLRRAIELVVGEDGRALEGEVARDLEPRLAAVEVFADLDHKRSWDAVGAQQQHVQRVPALPLQALLAVVRRPHVVRRERVHGAWIGHGPVRRDLGPRPNADAIGLRDPAVARERLGGRLGVGPHALLEGAPQLGLVRGANDVVALVLEGRVEEEAVVLDLEVLALFADAALAQGDELFALGEGTDGNRPFLESNWHKKRGEKGGLNVRHPERRTKPRPGARDRVILAKVGPKPK